MSDFAEIAEWDWVYSSSGRRLHHLESFDNPADSDWWAEGVATCGVKSTFFIPGIMSRMGMERCAHCCDKLGWPRGTGSPKNDDKLRPLVLAARPLEETPQQEGEEK